MAGACGSGTEPPPPPERLNNEIVFASNRDTSVGRLQLYRANADGSEPRLIPRMEGGFLTTTSVSPDGQWIAYHSSGQIWKMRVDGSELQNLTRNSAFDQAPAWSPDGSRIAFHSDRAAEQFKWDIFVMDADGSNVRQITNDPAIEGNPSWAPDGSALTYWHWKGEISDFFEVYVSTLDGQPPANISNHPSDDLSSVWSPDGSTIAFLSDRDSPNPIRGLYLMNPDGSNVRPIPLPFRIAGLFAWKPDASRIVVEEAEGDWDLWAVNPDGTDVVNLTNHPALDRFPAWSR